MRASLAIVAGLLAGAAWGEGAPEGGFREGEATVIERLNEPIAAEAPLSAPNGLPSPLRALLFRDKPVLVTLVYFRCPMLCDLLLGGLARAVREAGLEAGEHFLAATVSIDPDEPRELAASRQRAFLQMLGTPGRADAWRFLRGSEPSIRRLAESLGVQFTYDGETRHFAHVPVAVVLTPEGRVSRYLYGLEIAHRDLRMAVVEASQGRVGTVVDQVRLLCSPYDPRARGYRFSVKAFLQTGGLLIFAGVATMLGALWRRELQGRRR